MHGGIQEAKGQSLLNTDSHHLISDITCFISFGIWKLWQQKVKKIFCAYERLSKTIIVSDLWQSTNNRIVQARYIFIWILYFQKSNC